jgi:hypothetical protein
MTDGTGEPARRKSRAIWWVYTAFGVIALTVAAMGALAICAAEFKWQGFWRGAGQPFATVVTGMAALAAGGLAFYNGERQRVTDAEQREIESQQWREEQRRETAKDLRTRFIGAAAQLADEKAAMRSVGAYMIAALADDWDAFGDEVQHQVCINVLTGYLTNPNPTYADASETIPASAGEDGTVRATIVRLLAAHRAASDEARRARTKYAVMGADLRAVSLQHADLWHAYLSRVNLGGANLIGADLTDADLNGADLTGASLEGATLRCADLTKATLDRARHDHRTIWPDGFTPPRHDASAE